MKLNLGCGKDYRKGYLNVDQSYDVKTDEVVMLPEDLSLYSKNYFEEILANNVLCQIRSSEDFLETINELWRICKPIGKIIVRVPNARDICAFQDPMDCRYFTDQTFTYMQYGHRRYNQYGKHYGFKPFKVKLLENNGHQLTFELCPKK